jgi:hypothetical protein
MSRMTFSDSRRTVSLNGSSVTAQPILPNYRTLRSPHRYSDGPRYGRLIARKLGRITTRWQQYVLDVALERVDGPGSAFAYSDVTGIVGRRCGKTVTLMGVPLARGLSGPVALGDGRVLPFVGAHTAQNLTAARRRFLKDLVEPYQQHMSPAVWSAGHILRTAIGDTSMIFDGAMSGKDWRLPRASTIQVFAPTPTSVRGDGLFHLDVDEALAFTRDQGEQLMAAAGPTMSTMRGHGQIWAWSNISRLTDSRTWLYQLRERGRAAVASGANTGTAYFEFSYPEDADPLDEALWWDYYPALADELVRIQELRSDLERLGPESFAAEYLGQWPAARGAAQWSAIARDDWTAAATRAEQPAGVTTALGVDVDPFGRSASITAAVADPDHDGGVLLELIDHRPGSAWVEDAVKELAPSVQAIAVDDYGPGHDLLYALDQDPAVHDLVVSTKSADFAAACYVLDAGIREHRARFRQSDFYQVLTAAAAAAERTTGKAWQWERRVSVSQTPVVSATLAAWALGRAPDPQPFFVY